MADIADSADNAIAQALDAALKVQLQKHSFKKTSRRICVDCDFEIEAERIALGGVERCAECAGFYEQEIRQKGFKP